MPGVTRSPKPAAVLALAADLMFASRIRAAASAAGSQVRIARSASELVDAARTLTPARILIDLDARAGDPIAAIGSLKDDEDTRGIEIVAFVSHVREDAIQAARAAGADRVLARSAFVRELSRLVSPP